MKELALPEEKQQQINIDELTQELKKKYPKTKLYLVEHPYGGTFVIRQQTLADVREESEKIKAFVARRTEELGGSSEINNPESEGYKKLVNEYYDYSNELILTSCVVYPYDFEQRFKEGSIPAGIVVFLTDKIVEISGWAETEVEDL